DSCVAQQDLSAFESLTKQVGRAAADNVDAVIHEVLNSLNESHLLRLLIDDSEEDHREGLLHRGVLVELVEHDLRLRASLEFDDDAHAVAITLVANVADVIDDFFSDEVGDAFDEAGLVDLIWNLGDD